MKKINKVILVLIMSFAFSANMLAQNYNDALRLSEPGIITGARSLGMGNAYVALSDDFSASLFNPAGFGLIKKMELSGGLNYNSFNNNASFFNQNTTISNNVTNFSQVGVTLPFPTSQGSFVLAFGFNREKDFNKVLSFNGYNGGNNSYIQDLTSSNDDIAFKLALSYPLYDASNNYLNDTTRINGKLNQRGNYTQEGSLNSWSFSGAVEVQKDFFVGATLNLYNGTFKKTHEYIEEDLNNNYPSSVLLDPSEPRSADFKSFYLQDIIDWDISGVGLKLGALIKMDDNFNFGATVKFATKYTVKETYSLSTQSTFGTGSNFSYAPSEERLEYEISSPAEYSIGASYNQNNFTLSGNVTMIDYTQMKFGNGFDYSATMNKNADITDFMRTVYNLNAGIEYVIPNSRVALRAGAMLMPSPFKDDPSDYDKKYLTGGIGYNFSNRSTINIAYVYGWWNDIGDNYSSNVSRTAQDIKFTNIVTSIKFYL
ncbi:MAG: outer membrane protein transport protein [Ignavibacteriales bacterium]|nr:outer membrane protein transport protein [Ignavibacteriales bacterium]